MQTNVQQTYILMQLHRNYQTWSHSGKHMLETSTKGNTGKIVVETFQSAHHSMHKPDDGRKAVQHVDQCKHQCKRSAVQKRK